MLRLLGRPGFWLYIGTSLMAIAGWYWHAHQLGQASGLSFGFWGSGADRSSISLLLDLNGWINLLLRVSLRLLALVGVPFLLIGLRASWRSGGGQIAISGVVGVLLCTIATMRSSTIHEYYQLPLLLFSSPLIGLGWQTWHQQRPRWQPRLLLSLALVVSLTVLSLDYWARGASPARGMDAIGPHHPQGSAQRRADCECHQHRSHPAQPGPPSGLADLQQTTDAGATAALETKLEPAIWPAASCGTRPTGRCRSGGNSSCGRWWRQAPVPGWTHAARPI